jgi:transcription termination factor Rho
MSDELPPEDKPKKKAAAKKTVAKKAPAKKAAIKKPAVKKPAVKKTAAKKAAAKKVAKVELVEVELPLDLPAAPEVAPIKVPVKKERKTALQKKAAEILAKMQEPVASAHTPVEPAAAAPMEVPAPAPAPEPSPAPAPIAAAPAPEAPLPAPASPEDSESDDGPDAEGSEEASAPGAPTGEGQRKKTRWERWKERRERFKAEKLARRLAQQGGGGHQSEGGNNGNYQAREQQPQREHPQPREHQQPREYQQRDHQPSRGQQHGNSRYQQQSHDDDQPMAPETLLGPPEPVEGVLELNLKGQGFLRMRERMFAQHPLDAFVHADTIRQIGLREGMLIKGIAQKGSRGLQVTSISEVNGRVPESVRDLPLFEELKAINPNKRLSFETTKERATTRVIDMFTPVGRGQRGLIVAPPRTGKTTLLQHIAEAVVHNHPGMHLMILLVDERPEEVTEFKRVFPNAEIYASSNDQDIKSHTRIASFAIERAKRLVEAGDHVFMLLDSITRLARAFNNAKSGGATGSGGMGVGAMEIPRRLFAAARNTRGAGSLTILATALIETGSRMDDVIFLEFKGTGNMELVLDRKLAEQYYYPAVNIAKSGTRREELLLPPFQMEKINMLRRGLAGGKPVDAIQRVLTLCERYPSNAQMLVELPGKAG